MAKVLVTGATGFVGQALCRHLLDQGHKVVATYRRHPGELPCDWHQIGDMDGATDWSGIMDSTIDAVIHLAARVHVMDDQDPDPLAAFRRANRDATRQLAQAAARHGVKRFVFLSSIKVNGEFTMPGAPFEAEVQSPPQDPYGLSKWEAEQALQEVAQEEGLEVCVLRPPLVYGAGVKANFLNLIKLADKALPVPFGRLSNRRSLIFVGNLVDGLSQCAFHPRAAGQTYLISDGQDLSVADMFAELARQLGRPCRTFVCPVWVLKLLGRLTGKSAAIDRLTQDLQLDSTSICQDLNWSPPIEVAQAFGETVNWYKGCSSR